MDWEKANRREKVRGPAPQKWKPKKKRCTAITNAGKKCRGSAKKGGSLCGPHLHTERKRIRGAKRKDH